MPPYKQLLMNTKLRATYLGGIHIFHHHTCNVSLDVEDSMLKDRFEREI